MIRYVVGFAFTEDLRSVLLIRKNRPAWQSGLLNGVGGKVEPGEDFLPAMVREFREETGLDVPADQWRHVLTYTGSDYELRFFATETDAVMAAEAVTEEVPHLVDVIDVPRLAVVGNLRWIVPLCIEREVETPIVTRKLTA